MSDWPWYAVLGIGVAVGAVLGGLVMARRRWRTGRDLGWSWVTDALDQLHDGVILLRKPGRCRINDAAAQLLDLEGAGDARVDDLPPIARERLVPAAGPSSDETTRSVAELDRPDGSRTLELTAGPLEGGGRFLILQDLTVVTRLDHRRRDFVANASHELQTPIAALIGLLELLEDAESGYREEMLRRAQIRAKGLSEMTRDLMGLSRAEDPNWRPTLRSVSLESVFRPLEELFRARVEQKGLALELELASGPIELIVDPEALQTILVNLLENALAHTSEGSIRVEGRAAADGGVTLVVADTGSGIDPEHLPRVFERFYRGDPTRRAPTTGSGLGLSIVRHLLGRLGGRIAVQSRPGEGTRFTIELPPHPNRPRDGAGQAHFL